MPKLTFFNTATRKVEPFEPITPGKVGMYVCGPTVYSYAHIGNMRSYIFADTLRRTLEFFDYQVNHVMNITDVGHLTDDGDHGEDKLEVGAKREGLNAYEVAEKYTKAYFRQCEQLNLLHPNVICKATDHIKEQIEMIETLEKEGYTYKTSDGVYFDTSKFPRYGKLAKLDIEGLQEGHRVDLAEKRHKTDFALWKFSPPDEKRCMEWQSPWGKGFPGWHIECSAMSKKYLGDQFDIHTGGVDHIPIHHTNEIAQTECCTGKSPSVKYWMHGEFLVVDGDSKMSKSKGHILTVDVLKENGTEPLAYRVLCLQAHYRKQLAFNDKNLGDASRCYQRLYDASVKANQSSVRVSTRDQLGKPAQEILESIEQAMAADLNTPQAFANFFRAVVTEDIPLSDRKYIMEIGDQLLGLDTTKAVQREEAVPENIQKLIADRDEARKNKNWKASDDLRDKISEFGYTVLDSPEGTKVRRKC